MPILNYTTKITASKTIAEIQQILAENGATKIICDYDDQRIPSAITFGINVNRELTFFSLPANYEGMEKAMRRDPFIPNKYINKEQAVRVAWRVIKVWVEAQCAIVQAGLVDLEEVFLPYAVLKNGSTLYRDMKEKNNFKLLK